MEPAKQASVWQPLLILLIVAAGAWWLITTMTTGNPLWFSRVQPDYTPERIVIYHEGQQTTLLPANAGFTEITTALQEILSSFRTRDLVSVGLSDSTRADYRENGVVVEVYYPQEIEFNLPVRFTQVDALLVPVVGRHSDREYVFIGRNGEFVGGALQVVSRAPLDAVLGELGYLR